MIWKLRIGLFSTAVFASTLVFAENLENSSNGDDDLLKEDLQK